MDQQRRTALRLWIILNRTVESIEKALEEQVSNHGLSLTEFAILEVLHHKGPQPIGEIGDKVLLTSGSMTYVIDKLQKRGLLTRRKCTEDRRVLYAELTEKGAEKMERVFPEHAELITELMAAIPVEEQNRVADALKQIGLAAPERVDA